MIGSAMTFDIFTLFMCRYEPCGLVAMCGVRYGAVPIVSPVGGLVDIAYGRLGAMGRAASRPSAASQHQQPPRPTSERVTGDHHEAETGGHAAAGPDAASVESVEGPLGYLLDEAPGPAADAAAVRRSAAVLVSGMLQAAVNYQRAMLSPSSSLLRQHGTALLVGESDISEDSSLCSVQQRVKSDVDDGFLGRRERCMLADVSWSQPVKEWEEALRSLVRKG